MNRVAMISVLAGATMLASTALAQKVPITPGRYNVVVAGLAGGSQESRPRCLTAEHVIHPEAIFTYAYMSTFKPNPSNKLMNVSIGNGKVSYDIDTPFSITHVEGTVSPTEFSVIRSAKSKSGAGAPMTMKLNGKRIGDCRKGE